MEHTFFIYIFIVILIILFILKYLFRKPVKDKNELYINIYNKFNLNQFKHDILVPKSYTHAERYMEKLDNYNITNKNIFCIRGCDKLAGKNHLWYYLQLRYPRNFLVKFLPNTYLFNNTNDIKLLKKQYKPNLNYYLKKNIQKKKGIFISNNLSEILLKKKNDNEFVIVQEEIKNLFLINKRKINLRIYLLVSFKDGVQHWHVSSLGKCIYTNQNYKENSKSLEQNLTSYNLDNIIYNYNPFTLDELKLYMGAVNYNLLFSRIIHILSLCKAAYYDELNFDFNKSNNCFQFYGIDFVFTKDLNPYLLELNKGPQMLYINKKEKKLKETIIEDILSTVGIINSIQTNSFIHIH